ncbi:MAG TPA: threonine/serine dehydratase [Chloroflexia bacterium]|nr:threonine/serine dehydratase [Chloroflexia bacterium]
MLSAQESTVTSQDILQAAQRLRQSGFVNHTPLEYARELSARLGIELYQKLEIFQRTGSFKVRGATNKLLKLKETAPDSFEKGFVTASAGNHALGMSYAASRLGAKATIVLPQSVSPAKLEKLKGYPVELIVAEGNYDFAEVYARRLEQEQGLVFVSAYNDPEVIAGQGTVGMEALNELPDADILLVPVGGGGLSAGVALWAKTVLPNLRVIGVQSEASPAMQHSLVAGKLVEAPELPSLADGLAGNVEPGSITFELVQKHVDEVVLVTEEAIAEAINFYATELQLLVEGSGAVGLAALLSGKINLAVPGKTRPKVIDILSGRNIAAAKLKKILA